MGCDESDVGARRDECVRGITVAQRGDDGLTLRRPWRDRRPPDGEPGPFEVDVVQLGPVDEAARHHVADLGVVLPAVPEPAQHLDVVRRLGEQVGPRRLGDVAAAEVARRLGARGYLDPDPRPGPS